VVLSKTAPIGEFGELGLGDTLSDLKSDYFIKKKYGEGRVICSFLLFAKSNSMTCAGIKQG